MSSRLKDLAKLNSDLDLELFSSEPSPYLAPYHRKLEVFKKVHEDLQRQLKEELKISDRRERLVAKPQETVNDNGKRDIEKGKAIQQETLDALGRIIGQIDDTENIAIGTMKVLEENDEDLNKTKQNVKDIGDGIEQSKKLIRSIMMTFQRDKCIRVLLFIVLAGILCVLIWKLVDPNFTVGGGDGQPSGEDRLQ